MKKTILAAGAAGALALAGVAIAQQPAQNNAPVNPQTAPAEQYDDSAQPAGAYAEDSAAQADYGMAGERG